jgi:hypothetical protein
MPLSNKLRLPQPIVEAVKKETYDPGHGDFSATGLIAPPKIKVLEARHKEDIWEDVADKLYSLYGQTMHLILERSGVKLTDYMVEQRHYAQYGRWNVSAQFDCMFLGDGVLSDYKFTTAYSAQTNMDGSMDIKKEWYTQLNIQADILRRNPQLGINVQKLQIVALLRDWQPSKAASDPLYPQSQIVIVPIPMANPANVETYILHRCTLHQAARDQPIDDLIPECTKEERWEDETKFAAMKIGGKRATKVFDTEAEAHGWLSQQKDHANFQLDMRPGFARRCMGMANKVYCPARNFCHHYRGLVERLKAQEAV